MTHIHFPIVASLIFWLLPAVSVCAREARHESLGLKAARTNPDFTLVVDGKSRATIVIDDEAGERDRAVAKDLQRIFEKMAGCRLPIVIDDDSPEGNRIQIGHTDTSVKLLDLYDLAPEGFQIKRVDGDLCLAGRDEAGTEFAVYTFLERYCGVGWFWPGELGEVIPKQSTVAFGRIDDLEEPDYLLRRIRVKPRLHMPQGNFRLAEQHVLEPSPIETRLWCMRNRLGGSMDYAGTHTFGKMVPPAEYGPVHPEYFALVGDERKWKNFNGKHGCQLCTTHPEVIKLGIQWVRKFLDEHPNITCVTVAPNDGRGFCQCDRCRALDKAAGSPEGVISDRIITFANQIAEGVKKTHPDKAVLMLVYSVYRQPPLKVKPADNVWVQFCVNCDRFCNENKRRESYGLLDAWAKIAQNLAIYEYYVFRGSADMPRSFTPHLEESLRRYHHAGSRLFHSQSADNFGPYAMTYYVASRLLWNVDLKAAGLVDEYCRMCFGAAAGPMRKWFQMLDDRWRYAVETLGPGLYGGSPAYWLAMFPPDVLAEARDHIKEAKRLADQDVRPRVEFVEKELKYTELTLAALRLLKDLERAGIVKLQASYPTRFKDTGRYVEIDIASDTSGDSPTPEAEASKATTPATDPRELLAQTIQAWEARSAFIETLRGQHVIDYWHVLENADRDYAHDPTNRLKRLLAKYEETKK